MKIINVARKHRVLTSLALTAGLAVAGSSVAWASGSSADQGPDSAKQDERICVIVQDGKTDDAAQKTTVERRDGRTYVNGKEIAVTKARPGKCQPAPDGGDGHVCVVKQHDGKDGGSAADTTASAPVTGAQDGKDKHTSRLVPCPGTEHEKPAHGKPVCTVTRGQDHGTEKNTLEMRDGRTYVNGKEVEQGEVETCPAEPGEGGSSDGK